MENGPSLLRSQVVQAGKQLIEGKGMSERAMSVVRKNQVRWKVLHIVGELEENGRNKRVEEQVGGKGAESIENLFEVGDPCDPSKQREG